MSTSSVISRLAALPLRSLGAGLVLTATLVGASSLPAKAQFFNFWGGRSGVPYYNNGGSGALPPVGIFQILSRQGYRFISPIERRGRVYVADVVDPDGRRTRIVIDSFDGSVLQSFAAAPPPRSYGPGPGLVARGEAYPRDDDDADGPLTEPNVIPGIGSQDVPHVRTSKEPPRTAPLSKVTPRVKKSPAVAARTPTTPAPAAVAPAAAETGAGVGTEPAPSPTAVAPSVPAQSTAKAETLPAEPAPAAAAASAPVTSAPETGAAAGPAANEPAVADAAPAGKSDKASVAPTQPAAVQPVPAATPAATGKRDQPGYANGVPVNPLD